MTCAAPPAALDGKPQARAENARREELRVICGTRGVPDTVAPFRAWRGSRDLVAQSPKLHAPAVAHPRGTAMLSLAHRSCRNFNGTLRPRSEFPSEADQQARSRTKIMVLPRARRGG
jgi:hypothetical protein